MWILRISGDAGTAYRGDDAAKGSVGARWMMLFVVISAVELMSIRAACEQAKEKCTSNDQAAVTSVSESSITSLVPGSFGYEDGHPAIFNTAEQLRNAKIRNKSSDSGSSVRRVKGRRQRRQKRRRRQKKIQRGKSRSVKKVTKTIAGKKSQRKSSDRVRSRDWSQPELIEAVHGGTIKAVLPVPVREQNDTANGTDASDDETDIDSMAVPIQISNATTVFEKVNEYANHFDDDYQFPEYTEIQDAKGAWSEWGPCSESCMLGRQERTRSCGHDCFETEGRDCWTDCPEVGESESTDKEKDDSQPTEYGTKPENTETINPAVDHCGEWLRCGHPFLRAYLRSGINRLPGCPCEHPATLAQDDRVWDDGKQAFFRWYAEPAEGTRRVLHVYKRGARRCIRSRLQPGTLSFAAQLCCYDDDDRLITRGRAAGTPSLISPEMSEALHHKIDLLPWIICKGDWTRYNQGRPPNNARKCAENPDDEEFQRQVEEARNY